MNACPLTEALTRMLPGSVVKRRSACHWHSATFSGQRHMIEMQTGADRLTVDTFMQKIGDHEFSLGGQLVADIAITARALDQDGVTRLTVEALLLDEER